MPRQTPSQTVGPFFSHALAPAGSDAPSALANRIRDPDAPGAAIRIEGLVLDGAGDPVPDALLEIWQAGASGVRSGRGAPFRGFGRAATDQNGAYWFLTVKPGAPAAGGAPHVSVAVFARGMLNHAFTRLYFSDDRRRTPPTGFWRGSSLTAGRRWWPGASPETASRPTGSRSGCRASGRQCSSMRDGRPFRARRSVTGLGA